MTRKTLLLALGCLAAVRVLSAQTAVDRAFAQFWSARDRHEAERLAPAVVQSGVGFADAAARLKRGRSYEGDVPRGVVRFSRTSGAAEFVYTLDVPPSYDPATKHQVRIQLHGGVGRPEGAVRGNGSIGSLAGAPETRQIYVMPTSWADAPWWGDLQLENLRAILDRVKRIYNVDENRVVISGVSDGGTGAFYLAMRDTTPFAAFLPLNGFLMVLASPSLGLREQLFPQNLLNKPFFIVNGGKDPLYPASIVEPYVEHLRKGGAPVDYQPQPNGVHNTAWWPEVREPFEAFVRNHPREPHPVKLSWEAEPNAASRAHWLVIDKLRPHRAETPLSDLNDFVSGSQPNFGVRTNGMRITAVVAGSNADRIGFKPGDWVLSVNRRSMPGGLDLLEYLGILSAGEKVTFNIARDNQPVELSGVFSPQAMPRVVPLFPRGSAWGRVDLVREGNTVRATTRGVAAFTLLLSPDVFDFSRPVTVVADGRTVFSGRVAPSVATLMKWAALDNDRTMLYGTEVTVDLAF